MKIIRRWEEEFLFYGRFSYSHVLERESMERVYLRYIYDTLMIQKLNKGCKQ
jgi:hypothetical protein